MSSETPCLRTNRRSCVGLTSHSTFVLSFPTAWDSALDPPAFLAQMRRTCTTDNGVRGPSIHVSLLCDSSLTLYSRMLKQRATTIIDSALSAVLLWRVRVEESVHLKFRQSVVWGGLLSSRPGVYLLPSGRASSAKPEGPVRHRPETMH